MSKGIAVIGAAFGDEGKGLMTDYLAYNESNPCVIRFNGGAQAGHTVQSPDGPRHIFHHMGSGTMAEVPTYLSEYFILNPITFVREWGEFAPIAATLRNTPTIMADPDCPFTLMSDILLNQWAEEDRESRHGSCGVGIGETIERMENFVLPVRFGLNATRYDRNWTSQQLRDLIYATNAEWVPVRAAQLGVTLTSERLTYLNHRNIVERWIADFMLMRGIIRPVKLSKLSTIVDTFIFEGAQGLALDGRLDNPFFPHVTRSRTGRTNVVALAQKLKLDSLDFIYMTRSYLTRHGAGDMATRPVIDTPYSRVEDPTNVPHDFQGTMRFAFLNADLLSKLINEDIAAVSNPIPGKHSVAITCMDQLDNLAAYWVGKELRTCPSQYLPAALTLVTGLPVSHLSFGPTRDDVVADPSRFLLKRFSPTYIERQSA